MIIKTKDLLALIIIINACIFLAACGKAESGQNENSIKVSIDENEINKNIFSKDIIENTNAYTINNMEDTLTREMENKKEVTNQIKVSANGKSVVYELNNSAAADGLYEQLPLTIQTEAYSNNEIIFYPPSKLIIENTPIAEGGEIGIIAYYAPWGDVVMFYDNFAAASGLHELGKIVSGSEFIKSMTGTISITKTNE